MTHQSLQKKEKKKLVPGVGFEHTTLCLEGRIPIHLTTLVVEHNCIILWLVLQYLLLGSVQTALLSI